jgi:hypothetical protein
MRRRSFGARGSVAVLRQESATVRLYLEKAAIASEKASAATDLTTRRFYLAMESKWMDLAGQTSAEFDAHTSRKRRLRPYP